SGIGTGDIGDVTLAPSSFPNPVQDTTADASGNNAVFWGNLAQGGPTCAETPIQIRSAATIDGSTWTRQATAGCQPRQTDRPWLAAYTPPAYRGTDQAASHTDLYYEYHDFGLSNVWLETSTDGGQTWAPTAVSAVEPGSVQALTSTCNTIPDGVAVDQNGAHQGRIYVLWETSDLNENAAQGCDYTQPEYDVYVATSTDGSNTFVNHKANLDTGTHYEPWVVAGGNGGIDVVYYDTPYVQGVGALNKPAGAPSSAEWTVQMSQSLDGGKTWTQSNVSGHPIYFGDICSTGIFCGLAPDRFDRGNDRILSNHFGVAVGADGGARVAWTDPHDSWTAPCPPGGRAPCPPTQGDFAF